MENNNKPPTETETILMALDQISQTIDVMTSVVGRLRSYVQQRESAAAGNARDPQEEALADHILH